MTAFNGPALDATAKRDLYALLARLFACEVDLVLYRQLRTAEGTGLPWFEPALLGLSDVHAVEALAVEYCRLFVGPQPLCPPYASAQRGEALLGGRPRTRLEVFLAQHGVPVTDESWRIASPDHMAIELAALSHLYATGAPVAVVQEFLTQHVLPWAPAFLRQVESVTHVQLYRAAARLATILLDEGGAVAAREGNVS
jgi:TorA maturation chaperone TorD